MLRVVGLLTMEQMELLRDEPPEYDEDSDEDLCRTSPTPHGIVRGLPPTGRARKRICITVTVLVVLGVAAVLTGLLVAFVHHKSSGSVSTRESDLAAK